MDAKALAKSKRAHSQHHAKKKFHSNQKPKAPSNNEDRNLQSQVTSKLLPSNSDRYGEEESSIQATTPSLPDIVLPKSKGSDFRNLIAEAQSQMQSFTHMDDFHSLDDVFFIELSSGGSAMAAIRGETVLSWIGDDSFVVEEKRIANPEAPFLSLNLHTLAEQLEEMDLAERLFIEEDILPPELRGKGKVACDQQSSQIQTFDFQEETRNIEISSITECYEKGNIGDSVLDVNAASSGTSRNILIDSTLNPSPISSNQVNNVAAIELQVSSHIKAPKYTEQPNTKFTSENAKETTTFEPAAAEAELDMLLNSFSETTELDSSTTSGIGLTNRAPIAAELDDFLDDLLQETSNLMSHKEKSVHNNIQSPSPLSGTKSIAKDDFDSWLDTI